MKLSRDIVFLDFEATGTDPWKDRAVQIGLVRMSPEGGREKFVSLINPERAIPEQAVAVHHITDAMVASAPNFQALAPEILRRIQDADLGGFNIRGYDIPMLQAELERAGERLDLSSRRIVDAMTIFHRQEPRNLSRAYEFYCGRLLEGAHDAAADAEASLDVFLAQVERYQGRPGRTDLPQELQGLHDFCDVQVDSQGKFVWREGEAVFNFGKHRGRALKDVLKSERQYVEWLSGNRDFSREVADICGKALIGVLPRK
ncbi:MAG: 3'-5' exonuclease [Elusimicrobiota bacterium]|jgi:DNA polymerase-3 subunit epsilon